MRTALKTRVKAKDFLAPALVWALALAGCVIGDVKPAHDRPLVACAR